jgi:hypothetical protein
VTQTTVDYWRPAAVFLSYKREDAEQVKLPDPIVDKEQFNKELGLVAGRILRATYTLRLQRVGPDRIYEPCINFHTFDYEPPAPSLDLDLDWTEFFERRMKCQLAMNGKKFCARLLSLTATSSTPGRAGGYRWISAQNYGRRRGQL